MGVTSFPTIMKIGSDKPFGGDRTAKAIVEFAEEK